MSHSASFFKAPRYLLRKHNILRMVKQQPGIKTFVDIGCGAGELACSLAQKGYRGTGLDFSEQAITVANTIKQQRKIDDDTLRFKLGGLENITNDWADLVICCEVLEHIEDDAGFLQQLRPQGRYFIFSVPARQAWFDKFDAKVGHYRRYDKADLQKLLQDNGFEIIEFDSYGYPYINITRKVRQALASRVKHADDIKARTQASGTNPIKIKQLENLDIEPLMKLLYQTSRPFNRFDLSEGYLVLCKAE